MEDFIVPIKVRNWLNQFLPPEQRGEEVACEAVLNSNSVKLALPLEMIERLKLKRAGTRRVYTVDGHEHDSREHGGAEVEVQGRRCITTVIELRDGATPLFGELILQKMDWHISPLERKLVPNPKSPHEPLLPLLAFAAR
jgi:predicted aspartyl protease